MTMLRIELKQLRIQFMSYHCMRDKGFLKHIFICWRNSITSAFFSVLSTYSCVIGSEAGQLFLCAEHTILESLFLSLQLRCSYQTVTLSMMDLYTSSKMCLLTPRPLSRLRREKSLRASLKDVLCYPKNSAEDLG